MTCHHIPWP